MLKERVRVLKREEIKINDPTFLIFTKKEIVWMFIFIIIGSFISFVPLIPNDDPIKVFYTLLIFSLIIILSTAVKKISAYHYAIKIEHHDWKLTQWWWYTRAHFQIPFPLGLIIPFFFAVFTIGYLKPFSFLQFNAENIEEVRILKKHGPRGSRRKEFINESDLGYTAATGFYVLFFLAIIGIVLKPYFPSFGYGLAKYSVYYALWNLLPVSQLDGAKVFFGTTLLWSFILLVFLILLMIVI
jgi:membrane-associated protease RseP (regulator of RpoE activity)